jgi:hypothetical protein
VDDGGEAVDLLIDYQGRAIRPGGRSIAYAVSKLGFVHIQAISDIVIVTLQPELVSPLTMVGAMDETAHLRPERTIVVVASAGEVSGDFCDFTRATHLIQSLVLAEVNGSGEAQPLRQMSQ